MLFVPVSFGLDQEALWSITGDAVDHSFRMQQFQTMYQECSVFGESHQWERVLLILCESPFDFTSGMCLNASALNLLNSAFRQETDHFAGLRPCKAGILPADLVYTFILSDLSQCNFRNSVSEIRR